MNTGGRLKVITIKKNGGRVEEREDSKRMED